MYSATVKIVSTIGGAVVTTKRDIAPVENFAQLETTVQSLANEEAHKSECGRARVFGCIGDMRSPEYYRFASHLAYVNDESILPLVRSLDLDQSGRTRERFLCGSCLRRTSADRGSKGAAFTCHNHQCLQCGLSRLAIDATTPEQNTGAKSYPVKLPIALYGRVQYLANRENIPVDVQIARMLDVVVRSYRDMASLPPIQPTIQPKAEGTSCRAIVIDAGRTSTSATNATDPAIDTAKNRVFYIR